MKNLDIVIFSKDRACQLDLLIRSLYRYLLNDRSNIKIIYTYSDKEFKKGYQKLINIYSNDDSIKFIKEKDFKNDLKKSIKNDYVMFLVDDDVFIDFINLKDCISILNDNKNIFCISNRLGFNIKYCYPVNKFVLTPNEQIFKWREFEGDFNYPFSLDGNIYRTKDIINYIKNENYFNPNMLESCLFYKTNEIKQSLIYMPKRSCLISIPCNKVQTTYNNRCENYFSSEHLNYLYLEGKRINLEPLSYYTSISPHAKIEYSFEWS